MRLSQRFAFAVAILLLVGCATTRPVDMSQPRRLVGTENGVRVDALVVTEQLSPSSSVAISYDITNERSVPIAVADLVPESSYDPETRTVTVTFGSEVPGYSFLPRLLLIPAGAKKSFSSRAVVNVRAIGSSVAGSFGRFPNGLRVKVHFLTDLQPFSPLIGIPERALHDPKLADALLPKWLERNETIITNVLPMRWVGPFGGEDDPAAARRRQP